MKRNLAATLIAMLFLSAAVFAQAPPQAPKPAPELERLKYFAGNWTSDSEMKASPFGPAGKFTSNDRDEWMSGGFFLVAHSDFKGAMRPGTELAVLGYSAENKADTDAAINSMGDSGPSA